MTPVHNLDLIVRRNDGGPIIAKPWSKFGATTTIWGSRGDPIRIFAINETTVGALPWHQPDGCRLVETINAVSMA